MSTTNGMGTLRYDWHGLPDGTALATVWFVVGFFPIIPLRREHLRVINSGIQRSGIVDTIAVFGGIGEGFQSTIEVLGTVPLTPLGVVRTYVMGFIVVPVVAFIGPLILAGSAMIWMEKRGWIAQGGFNTHGVTITIAIFIWAACLIGLILDRTAGRHHIDRISNRQFRGPSLLAAEKGFDIQAADPIEPPTPVAGPKHPPSWILRQVPWIVGGLSIMFGITSIVALFSGDFQAAIGGAIAAAVCYKMRELGDA